MYFIKKSYLANKWKNPSKNLWGQIIGAESYFGHSDSVLICDIHTARFQLDCNQAAWCPCMLLRVWCSPHSEGCEEGQNFNCNWEYLYCDSCWDIRWNIAWALAKSLGLRLYFTVYPSSRHNKDTVQHDRQTVSLYRGCQSRNSNVWRNNQ